MVWVVRKPSCATMNGVWVCRSSTPAEDPSARKKDKKPAGYPLEEVEGIKEMTSSSQLGASSITIEFDWSVDLNDKLIEVINKHATSQALNGTVVVSYLVVKAAA